MKIKILSASCMIVIAVAAVFIVFPDERAAPVTPADIIPGHAKDSETGGYSVTKAEEQTAPGNAPEKEEEKVGSQTANDHAQKTTFTKKRVTLNGKEYPVHRYKTMLMPNDPSASQWWVAQSKLDQAWDIPPGSAATTLAIIDTGFALSHEEFAGRWHVNTGESGATEIENSSALNCTARSLPISAGCNLIDDDHDGTVDNETGTATYENPSRLNCTDQSITRDKSCNRVDDDGNGYIDDLRGWDFINNDNSSQAGELNPGGTGTTHGTRVAGIAAATGGNAKGIAGVDWATKILPIQALDDDSYGDTLSVGRSIYYAVQQKADVISVSLGSDQPDNYVREAVQAALAAGIVVVAASGNDGCDCMVYPANYPEVLAVGALNSSSQVASFTSYGANLDMLAPGVNMASADWTSSNQTSAYVSGINGTSFATPYIGGLMTRIKSQRPAATPAQLIAAVTENGNRLSLSPDRPHDSRHGFGTVDAHKVTARMASASTEQIPYAFTPVSRGNKLNPAVPAEKNIPALLYSCDKTTTPSTAVYELIKGDSHFFTMSKSENYQAITAGYGSTFLMYACLQQPHDSNAVMHGLNVFQEFRNKYPKP